MPRTASLSDWMVLLALTVFWGSAFLFTELALQSFPPALLVAVRIAIALAVLLLVLYWSGTGLPRPGRKWIPILIMATLGTILPFNLIAWAQRYIDSGLTAILMAVMPLFVVTLSHYFIPGERLSGLRIAGFLVGFAGVFQVIGPDLAGLQAGRMETWGMLAVLVASLSYAAGSIYTRRCGHGNPIPLAAGMLLIATAVTLPASIPSVSAITWPPKPDALMAIAVLGVICTAFSTILFFRLVQGPGPTFLSLVNYLVPAWAVLAGALVLGESIERAALTGLALILTGIAISEGGQRVMLKIQDRRLARVAASPELAMEDAT